MDIFVNANKIYETHSKTGDFEINGLPVPTGRGEVVVESRDITGKVKTFILPFYITPNLLAKGLTDFSFETGVQRKKFSVKSNKYQYLVSNGDYNWGVSDIWTAGVHFESLKDRASLGTANHFQMGNIGSVAVAFGSNIHNLDNTQKGILGYAYQGKNFSFNCSTTKILKNYQDIFNYPFSTPSGINYQTSFSYANDSIGSFFLNYLSYQPPTSLNTVDRIEMITAAYEKQLTKSSSLRFSVGTDLKSKRKSAFASLSFNAVLGKRNISLNNTVQKGKAAQQVILSSQSNTPLGWGYKANLGKGNKYSYDVEFTKNTEHVNTALYLYSPDDHDKVEQISLTGGIVVMDKAFYLTRPIYNSLALVKVGELENIPVYNNNLKVGYTNRAGKVLLPNVLSYVPSEIRFDQKKLPLDTNFASVILRTQPKWKSGVIVNFEVTKVKSLEMTLLNSSYKTITVNTQVNIEGITDELLVGYEGKLYINDIGNLKTLSGKIYDNSENCLFEIQVDENLKDPVIDLGEVICS